MAQLIDDDVPTTIGERGKRVWIYPSWLRGRMLTWRTASHLFLFTLLLVGPWIDVGGNQAIRFDIPGRRMHLFGMTFFATDGAYLLVAFGLFFTAILLVTALFGRAWCGWACPQTVFLETIIRPIERLIEGKATRRKALDRGPWNFNKIVRKCAKYSAFLLVCGAIGTTMVAYFLGREGVYEAQKNPWSHPIGTSVFVVTTALAFFDFAWFREQTCLVACPYGRFQSVLLDEYSLSVNYDAKRGEPRGKVSLKTIGGDLSPPVGDCVDCKRCVQVCPTGIDIRRGVQMECVQCMACIDACDDMMHRVKRPPGLIAMSSEAAGHGLKTKFLRARVVVYFAVLVLGSSAASVIVWNREALEVALNRQPTAPYELLNDGRIQNALRLRLSNRSAVTRRVSVSLASPPDGTLVSPRPTITVQPEEVIHSPIFLLKPTSSSRRDYVVHVEDDRGFSKDIEIPFIDETTNRAGNRDADR